MAYRIQYRRATAAVATANNVVLAAGEPGLETDTGKVKVGDGITAWNSLAYEPSTGSVATAKGEAIAAAALDATSKAAAAAAASDPAGSAAAAVVTAGTNADTKIADERVTERALQNSTFGTPAGATLAARALAGSRKTGNVRAGSRTASVAIGGHNAFPGLTVLADGGLLTVWRSSANHNATSVGVLKARAYNANGTPRGAAYTIISDALDVRDPMLTRLPDGRVVIQFYKHNGTNTTGVYVATSTDSGATFAAPVLVPFPLWDTERACSGRMVVAANGDWLVAGYGRNTATYWRIHLMRSTDGGATWTGEVVVAEGQTESRNYTEPVIGLLPDGSTLMCLIRVADSDGTDPAIYRTTSTDNGLTWAAESSVVVGGGGRPAWITLNSGGVLLCHRSTTAPYPMQYRTSWDLGATWTTPAQLGTTPTNQGTYAQPVEIAPGLVGVAYAIEASLTASDVSLAYLADGYGFTPLGDDLTEPDASIFMGAGEGYLVGSAPVLTQYTGWPVWSMSATGTDQIGFTLRIPEAWATFNISYLWVNMAANAGDVVFRQDFNVMGVGAALASTAGTNQTVTAAANLILAETVTATDVPRSGEYVRVKPTRLGADAADTLVSTVGLIGVKITRTT